MLVSSFTCLSPRLRRHMALGVCLATVAPAALASGLDAGVTLGHLRLVACAAELAAGGGSAASVPAPAVAAPSDATVAMPGGAPLAVSPDASPARTVAVRGSTAAEVLAPDGSMATRDGEQTADDALTGGRHRSKALLPGVSASAEAGPTGAAGSPAAGALTRGGAARPGTQFRAEADESADYAVPPRGCLLARVEYRLDFLAGSDLRAARIELAVALDGGGTWTERAVVRELSGADGESHGGTLELELRNPADEPAAGRLAARARAVGRVTALASGR